MKHIKLIGSALVVMTAIFALTATSAGASTFLATATGELTGKLVSLQKFQTKAGAIECSSLQVDGLVTTTKPGRLRTFWNWLKCKLFGLAGTALTPQVDISASGSVSLNTPLVFHALACLVTFPAPQTVGTVKYTNVGSEIELTPAVTGLTSEGVGAACTYAQESKGTYEGKSRIGLIGGTLKWDA